MREVEQGKSPQDITLNMSLLYDTNGPSLGLQGEWGMELCVADEPDGHLKYTYVNMSYQSLSDSSVFTVFEVAVAQSDQVDFGDMTADDTLDTIKTLMDA